MGEAPVIYFLIFAASQRARSFLADKKVIGQSSPSLLRAVAFAQRVLASLAASVRFWAPEASSLRSVSVLFPIARSPAR